MLPASQHPLSVPIAAAQPSPTPSLANSGLLAPPSPTPLSPRPLFPPDPDESGSSTSSSPALPSPSPLRTALGLSLASPDSDDASYFPQDHHLLRPALTSTLTLRANSISSSPKNLSGPGSPEAPDEPLPPEPLPKHLSFPQAPHLLPTDSTLLSALPRDHLLALVRALSRELGTSRAAAADGERECEAMVGMLKDKGVGEGEVQRARVRARIEEGNGGPKEREWKVDLRDPRAAEEDISADAASELETSLDLDDLAEAISENAFSFASSSRVSLDSRASLSLPDEPGSDTESVSALSLSSQQQDTLRLPVPTPKTRQRHASLSSRIFSSFSHSAAASTSPPPVGGPTTTSSSSSSSNLTVPHQVPPLTVKKRHGRSDSLRSVSSIASSEAGSIVERKESGGGGYGEWIGWRGWSSSSGKGKSTLASESVRDDTEEIEEESEGDDESEVPTSERAFRHRLGSNTSGEVEGPSAVSSSVLSERSHATSSLTDAPSSPTTSTSPPSSSTPDSNNRTSPILTSSQQRRTSIPLLTSQHSVPSTASVSTPTPTSTLSTPSNGPSHSPTPTGDDRIVHPSHFTAVALAATRWISPTPSSPSAVLLRPATVGTQVRALVDALLSSVASAAPLPLSASPPQLQRSQFSSPDGVPAGGPNADPNQTLKARRLSEPAFLSVPVPLYLAPADRPREKSYVSSAKGTIGRALGLGASASSLSSAAAMARSASDGVRRSLSPTEQQQPNLTLFPKLSTLSRYSPFAQPALSTPSTQVLLSSHSSLQIPHSPSLPSLHSSLPAPSMELDTISGEAAPPTLSSPSALLAGGSNANGTGSTEETPMVDRYGFLYDVRSGMKLLREARKKQERARRGGAASEIPELDEAQLRAAAALIQEAEVREEEDEREQSRVEVDNEIEALREALGLPASSPTQSRSPAPRLASLPLPAGGTSSSSLSPSTKSRDNSPTTAAPPSKPPTAPSATGPSSARLIRSKSHDATSAPPPPGGPQSMKRLLNQLTEMHDLVEKSQKEAWEAFIARRQGKLRNGDLPRRAKQATTRHALVNEAGDDEMDLGWNENLVGVAQMGVAGKSGKEDWSEFKTLVRKGVPIAFRPKIWAECSGANEAREPGLYQELLSLHKGEENQCLNQIDMDCHRTFPTNVFFAGNGPGVAKLRNVLIAYSWRNPKIGYCQGMNNLTATLLLTHPAEEDAFWVLVCIIEKILPSDYYTSHLLVSQADQRVLRDLVERIMPDVAAHLEDLGVELPAITFGWFLSLFTDALPIQTLLRVWDLLFVFGTVILFRVAIATIQMNTLEILACDSAANLYALMRTMTTHLYQVDRLLKIACEDLRPLVKDRDISALRNRHVAALQIELAIPDEDRET
ncbi:hypothetical protein RQP46_001995 [Phenoliferia psychrophenolica]